MQYDLFIPLENSFCSRDHLPKGQLLFLLLVDHWRVYIVRGASFIWGKLTWRVSTNILQRLIYIFAATSAHRNKCLVLSWNHIPGQHSAGEGSLQD